MGVLPFDLDECFRSTECLSQFEATLFDT
jgi:hypothetical protein